MSLEMHIFLIDYTFYLNLFQIGWFDSYQQQLHQGSALELHKKYNCF